MRSETEQMERDILRVYRCACGQERPDVAEFMLATLEKLDREREGFPLTERPLMEAYRDIASRPGEPRCAAQRLSTSKSEPHS